MTILATLTALTALIALGISFQQWQTAHQKVVLDLFDRRLKVYQRLKQLIDQITRTSDIPATKLIEEVQDLQFEARFLFGDDVNSHIGKLIDTLWNIRHADTKLGNMDDPKEMDPVKKERMKNLAHLYAFHREFSALCEPYMKMDQKLIRPLVWVRTFFQKNGSEKQE